MNWWDRCSDSVTHITGGRYMFLANVALTLMWLGLGPLTHWSDTWQLWANTITTIITYLMVFVIQHSQNKSANATHAKLDELIRSSNARNELAGLDLQSEKAIEDARR